MVDADGQAVVIGQPQVVKENFRLRAGVVKDQRGIVFAHLLQHRRDGIGCAAAGPWRGFFGAQHLDVGGRAGVGQQNLAGIGMAGHQMRDGGGVFDRGGQAHAFQIGAEGLQPRQRQHHLIAPLAFGEGVDFVDHHPFQAFEHARRVFVADQQGEAFGRGQQDMRRIGALAFAARGGVSPVRSSMRDRQVHFLHRRGQVALDVCRQRLERRDIERVHALMRAVGQINQGGQETRQGFAAAGGGDQQQGGASARSSISCWCGWMDQPLLANQSSKVGGRARMRRKVAWEGRGPAPDPRDLAKEGAGGQWG